MIFPFSIFRRRFPIETIVFQRNENVNMPTYSTQNFNNLSCRNIYFYFLKVTEINVYIRILKNRVGHILIF